jgi:hypothetical protein
MYCSANTECSFLMFLTLYMLSTWSQSPTKYIKSTYTKKTQAPKAMWKTTYEICAFLTGNKWQRIKMGGEELLEMQSSFLDNEATKE